MFLSFPTKEKWCVTEIDGMWRSTGAQAGMAQWSLRPRGLEGQEKLGDWSVISGPVWPLEGYILSHVGFFTSCNIWEWPGNLTICRIGRILSSRVRNLLKYLCLPRWINTPQGQHVWSPWSRHSHVPSDHTDEVRPHIPRLISLSSGANSYLGGLSY